MALVIDGTGDITGLTRGAIEATAIGSGAVLQAVQGTSSAAYSTTSTTYGDIGLSVSITPSSSNSKILILTSIPMETRSASDYYNSGPAILLRDSTTIHTKTFLGAVRATTSGGTCASSGTMNLMYLDSPTTTSPITYKIQGKSSTGYQVVFNGDSGSTHSQSTIIAMEIAG